MDHNHPTFPRARPHTRRSQRTYVADGRVEAECSQGDARCSVAVGRTDRHHLPRFMTGGAYATHRLEIDPEIFFGKLNSSAPCGDFRYEPPPDLGEGLPGLAASVGAVAHSLIDHEVGVRLRLFDQSQRPLVVGGVAR